MKKENWKSEIAPSTEVTRGEFLQVTAGVFVAAVAAVFIRKQLAAPSTYLLTTHVAGTAYVPKIDRLVWGLRKGSKLVLEREPSNPCDELAILVKTPYGKKLGYIPQVDNSVMARLLDGKKTLYGQLVSKEKIGTWNELIVDVFLEEANA